MGKDITRERILKEDTVETQIIRIPMLRMAAACLWLRIGLNGYLYWNHVSAISQETTTAFTNQPYCDLLTDYSLYKR